MKEKISSLALARFKRSPSSYISVGVLCGLLFVLAVLLNIFDSALIIIAIPFIILPSLFAATISCYYLEADQPISMRAFFHYYVGFYRPQFRGSFRGISSLLKAFGIYVLFFIFAYIFFYFVFQQRFGDTFNEAFNELMKAYSNPDNTYEDLINVLNDNNGLLYRFVLYTNGVAIPFGITSYMYFISYSSLSIYYRANVNSGSGALIRLALGNTYARNSRKMRKDWFKLNWPLLALAFLGGVVGEVIAKFAFRNLEFIGPFAFIGAVIFIIAFLPFYFANMEVIFHRYEIGFKEGNREAIAAILARIQSSIDLSEEEKKELENSFQQNDDIDNKENEQ